MNIITHSHLRELGFRSYQTSMSQANSCWQRTEHNDGGKKMYSVNVEEWPIVLPPTLTKFTDWVVEVHLYPEELDDHYGVVMKFCCRTVVELEKVEGFVRHSYFHHRCRPDIPNN